LANPDHALPSSWRSSVSPNGTPGGDDSAPFTGNPTDDLAHDGYNVFLEYAMGTSDGSNSSIPNLQLGNETVAGGTENHLTILFRINLAAVGLSYVLQASDDLSAWDTVAGMTHLWITNNGDGTATLKYQSTAPSNGLPEKNFYRIQVSGSL
jgi:hypothetical protein